MEETLKVRVSFLQHFMDITKKKSEDVELRKGSSVGDLIALLTKRYGDKFKESILVSGKLREEIMMLKNGVNLTEKDFHTELKDGDEIVFTVFISGG